MTSLVFLHGLGSSSRVWDNIITHLSETDNIQIFALNLPGFAHISEPEDDQNIILETRDQIIRQFADHEQIILVGHSYGGAIASEVALALGSKVIAVHLLAPGGYPATPEVYPFKSWYRWRDQIMSVAAYIGAHTLLKSRKISRFILRTLATQDLSKHQMKTIFTDVARARARSRGRLALYASTLRSRIHHLSTPVYLYWGEDDQVISINTGTQIAPLFANLAAFTHFSDTGHILPYEQSKIIADMISSSYQQSR